MAEIIYAAEMKGSGGPVEGREGVLRAATSGVGPNGESIIFESEVVMSDDGFTETGSITLDGRGSLTFDTIGIGQMGPTIPDESVMHGTIMWNVTGGDGEGNGGRLRVQRGRNARSPARLVRKRRYGVRGTRAAPRRVRHQLRDGARQRDRGLRTRGRTLVRAVIVSWGSDFGVGNQLP